MTDTSPTPSDPDADVFEDRPALYDAMVNWPRRLAREEPFYRWLFGEVGARRVLDVACGPGHHVKMFHDWGLEAEGADASEGMIAHCRQTHRESPTLRWVVRSFDRPAEAGAVFDVALCVGNSLALVDDLAAVADVLHAMLASVREGGACVAQVLNLFRLEEGPTTWQKCLRITMGGREHLILKGLHRVGSKALVDFVDVPLDEPTPQPRATSRPILGIEATELAALAERAGAAAVQLFGSYDREPFDRTASTDLILVARR